MIFASDLDGTLIYSPRYLDNLPKDIDINGVDLYKGKEYGYITKNAMSSLKLINKNILFIPVTTRTLNQYKRMSFFYTDLSPKYAVTANGGVLLENGGINRAWESIIAKRMQEYIPIKDMIKMCRPFLESSFVKSYRLCQELFLTVIIDQNTLGLESVKQLEDLSRKYDYVVSRQGKKVYIVPGCINKWSPIEYISKIESPSMVISAGDSMLDYPLLKNCDYGIVPNHGELKNKIGEGNLPGKNIHFTENEAILAGEEIVNTVKSFIDIG